MDITAPSDGTYLLDTFGSEFISGGSDLTITGAGSTIRGIAELFLGDDSSANTTFTLSAGADWPVHRSPGLRPAAGAGRGEAAGSGS